MKKSNFLLLWTFAFSFGALGFGAFAIYKRRLQELEASGELWDQEEKEMEEFVEEVKGSKEKATKRQQNKKTKGTK